MNWISVRSRRDRDGVHDAGLPCPHLRHLHETVWNGSAIGLFGDQTLRTDDRRTNFAQGRQTVFRQRRKESAVPILQCRQTLARSARYLQHRGGKLTDVPRRALFKALQKKAEHYHFLELKSDRRSAFFEWLDTLRISVDFEGEEWLFESTRAFLERREPKTKWSEVFDGLRAVRPPRMHEGWERDGTRLFLAPDLYNEALLVQYLLSRSHEHGGRTLEGRLTLQELIRRMRHGGYLTSHGIENADQFETLEKLVEEVAGAGATKIYFILDRREFLKRLSQFTQVMRESREIAVGKLAVGKLHGGGLPPPQVWMSFDVE